MVGIDGGARDIDAGVFDKLVDAGDLVEELGFLAGPPPGIGDDADAAAAADPATARRIASLVKRHSGLDIACYKSGTFWRRVRRRMGCLRVTTLGRYIEVLRADPGEAVKLAGDMLIGVTRFFRDADAFERLRTTVLPGIVRAARGRPPRIWVPGCATGEEAYTIAILLEEVMQELGIGDSVGRIFATDLNRSLLDIASRGHYPGTIARELPPEILEKYFSPRGNDFVVVRPLRERIVFARHNLLKDPPFTRLDLVSCRNLLIYLEPDSQEALLSRFHFALNPGGALLLGRSEVLGQATRLFAPVDAAVQLFRKSSVDSTPGQPSAPPGHVDFLEPPRGVRAAQPHQSVFFEKLLNIHLLRAGRTCFVLNSNLEILHSFGNPGRFIEISRGRTSFALTDLLQPALAAPLTSMAGCLLEDDSLKACGPLTVPSHGGSGPVSVSLELFDAPDSDHRFLLAFLDETPDDQPPPAGIGETLRRITELENEVVDRKERLRFVLQELEAANEELQTSNEELITTNEQLQSANEELESLNEELQSTNAHCRERIDDLEKSNDDLGSFIESADFGIFFIDLDLRIRRHTAAGARMTGLLPHDEGRLAADLSHPLLGEATSAAKAVINGSPGVVKAIDDADGEPLLLRASPYLRKDGVRIGALVCLVPLRGPRRGD